VQHDQQTIADYPVGGVASTPTNRYVYASYIDEPVVRKAAGTGGTIHYYHRNQQYSITAMTTSTGAVAERYAYTAYGQPTILNASGTVLTSSAVGNRYTYTGREWDETLGLHHFRARWMSSLAGRFLTKDSIGYEGSEWNLYELFDSKATTATDPTGLIPGRPPRGAIFVDCVPNNHFSCNSACLAQKGRRGQAWMCWEVTVFSINLPPVLQCGWTIRGRQCRCVPRKGREEEDKDDDKKGSCVLQASIPPKPGQSCFLCKYKCTGTRYMAGGVPIERYQKGGCHGERKWVWGHEKQENCEKNTGDDEPLEGLTEEQIPWDYLE